MFGRVISVELGLIKTKICEVDYKKKSPRIYNTISFDTPEGSYQDGHILKKEALAAAIEENIKKAGIKSKRLVFSLMSSKIANREVTIPLVKKERIQDVVMANVEQYFPMNVTDHAITYSILEKLNIDNEKKLRLLVLAAPDGMINEYYELAKLLGYEILAVDYMGNSVYQLVKNNISKDISMVIHINEQMTILNIFENGTLILPRLVNFGYMTIIDAIINGNTSMPKEEAYGLLCNKALLARETSVWDEVAVASSLEVSSNEIGGRVNESLQYLIENIARIMDYISRNENKKINAIYIMGQATRWNGVKEYISNSLGVEVKYLDSAGLANTKKNPNMSKEDMSGYMPCIGASIQPVRFIPKEYLEQIIRSSNLTAFIFTFTSGVLISIALILISFLSYRNNLNKHNILKTEIDNLYYINEIYTEHEMISEKLKQIETIYDLTENSNEHFIGLLEDIEAKIPSRALVDSINVTSQGIVLSLVADSEVTVAKTLMQLKSIEGLNHVFTTSLDIAEDEYGLKTVSFVVDTIYDQELLLGDNLLNDVEED